MNHIYCSIWNEALGAWVAVSEYAKSKGKSSNSRRKLLVTGLLVCTTSVWALPIGNQLVTGQSTVSTPSANVMQIDQASQRAAINWQGFSIGQNETVNIQQPNANAALLNRVVGQDTSQIQGKLNANGQVYLVNPNGVIFSNTAQVDVGGLIATTHDISNQDFISGKNHFTQNGATGKVENHGTINAKDGGVVALISETVTNTGTINSPKGTIALTAGKTVDLDFQGDGLVEVKILEAALNAQIKNQGVIQADGGRVVMSAKTANQLIDTVINQQGIVKAQGLSQRNGEIILDGGNNGIVQVSGELNTGGNAITPQSSAGGNINITGANIAVENTAKLDASGTQQGGTVQIGDKQATQQVVLAQGSTINSNAIENGTAGKIEILANMDKGQVNVAGNINASAPKQGNGGVVETSAAKVNIADSANISTKANNGITGTWLIDPTDFTIAASGGNMTGTALSKNLASANIDILSTVGTTGINGDVNVNDAVNWSANTLTLDALRNININANLNGSNTAKLVLKYGQASTTGGDSNYFINGVKVNLAAGQNFSTQKGTTGTLTNYTVITSLGTPNSSTGKDLQGMNGNFAGLYVLGTDIDATATSGWNAGAGFLPVGSNSTPFKGNFDGLGHTITGLTINRATDFVGLFGATSNANLRNIGLSAVNITGKGNVGALVGQNANSIISNVYATGTVIGSNNNVGGLVGDNSGTISSAYATVNTTGNSNNRVGGLVGNNTGMITNAYATGKVSSDNNSVGGLVGDNSGTINNTYATGYVTGKNFVGGLVGKNSGAIINSFWDIQTSNQPVNGVGSGTTTGVTGKTTIEMMQLATFSKAGWSIAGTGDSSATWRIYEDRTHPLLNAFLIPIIMNTNIIVNTPPPLGSTPPSLGGSTNYLVLVTTGSGTSFYITVPYGSLLNLGTYPLIGTLPFEQQDDNNIMSVVIVGAVNSVNQEQWLSQTSPLQRSTVFSPAILKELATDKSLLDIKDDGIRLPIKPHTIITLSIPCSFGWHY
jgi:filamentous hemagglutinin family protein